MTPTVFIYQGPDMLRVLLERDEEDETLAHYTIGARRHKNDMKPVRKGVQGMRLIHAVVIGGMLGVVAFFALPVVIGLPIFVLTHSGDSALHALGHRLSEIVSPIDEVLWEQPLELSAAIGERFGGAGSWVGDAIATVVLYGLPAMVGALVGLAAWAIRRPDGRKD